MKSNPFITGSYNGHEVGRVDAQGRIDLVREFDEKQCRDALKLNSLQKTVQDALWCRIEKLGKEVKSCKKAT